MLWFYRFFRGYVYVSFSGDIVAQVLNICERNGITLWNMKSIKQEIRGCVSISDFWRLRPALRKSGIRVHILRRAGLPFFLNRNRKRVGFLAGIILFIVILNFLSGFIWNIKVVGNERVDESEILNACEKIGIFEGVRSRKIDPKNQKQDLILEIEQLAWASINIEGSVLTVEVTEIKDTKDKSKDTPSNLVASTDGIIKKINVTSGDCTVKVGQAVAFGDILVSGVIERADRTEFVHSTGNIIAETRRTLSATVPDNQEISTKTGEASKKSVLCFFGLKVPLYLGEYQKPYTSEIKENRAMLFGERLPISIITRTFSFRKKNRIKLSEEAQLKAAQEEIERQIKELNIEKYELIKADTSREDGIITLFWSISAEENIAFQNNLVIISEK